MILPFLFSRPFPRITEELRDQGGWVFLKKEFGEFSYKCGPGGGIHNWFIRSFDVKDIGKTDLLKYGLQNCHYFYRTCSVMTWFNTYQLLTRQGKTGTELP